MKRSNVVASAEDETDRMLLGAIAAEDRRAFEVLYRRHRSRVYGYIRGIVRDPELAEDLLTETMVLVWQRAAGFAGHSRVSTWMIGIARHKAIDAVRASARRAAGVSAEANSPPDPPMTPADSAHAEQLASLTHQALRRLTRNHFEALRLAFFEELPYSEIARVLAIPPNTVKSRVHYAKAALGRHMYASLPFGGNL
ncbi:MAG TPA: sigma-70 family RNA polymerase sigma factor [Anaeromyxobacteraceae bacterium]|nr:sigma-70 family RNA polymerase sigma factor [Anaeromyxobacteraceae bacterium]